MTAANGFAYETSWGATIRENDVLFRLWAPECQTVELAIEQANAERRFVPMDKSEDGWWSVATNEVRDGDAYGFRVNGDLTVPDPAARAQVDDVHGLSRLVDPRAFTWKTAGWKGRPWHESVFYELHTGTFTPEGTFEAIIEKLDYLKETGITAIELMPVAQFGGRRGWGYDGVLLYCPHEAYGGVEGLKRLVDAAHERGLMVFLDVVYNHFGPDGNYIGAYAPGFFHPEIHTAWGAAIAYDQKAVRDFMIQNALYWLQEYRIDGLRLDAIDSIEDMTDEPLIRELAAAVRETIKDRHVHLTSEDARNITWHIERKPDGEPALVSGEWNDDFHHTAHVVATKESESYYQDYARSAVKQMARSLATGFVFQGQHSRHRDEDVGFPSGHLPPVAFVNFIQNHDQIGNRAFGDRLTDLASKRMVEMLQAILFLSPQIPLMFMGEEYGETNPFCFFTDFHGELGEIVREGRRSEFKKFAAFRNPDNRKLIPDPNSESTFLQCKIDWSTHGRATYRRHLAFVSQLLRLRRERIMPLLKDAPGDCGKCDVSDDTDAFAVSWTLGGGHVLHLFANLDDEPWKLPADVTPDEAMGGDVLFEHEAGAAEALKTGVLPGPSVVFRFAKTLQIGSSHE
ncbi:malto-oligosyltrehalose trehalohydrolase [Mangrovibrevibacter kandeliae]|uniref:malto-oligosyltrehalose trehalohydrolase n=1 Tax=Mangrovibrevibacter kandeliae TaxID=2968473 RepID=UPI002117FE43|nr:malto-oligosyltrehalose trehalohydrolase [Aurantimonas sp. CSK15Z-1]MCQ8780612.1 malto-oligosyltrehalose trehalohydrolase [Aurantimonas sp. CSK15Z-1]